MGALGFVRRSKSHDRVYDFDRQMVRRDDGFPRLRLATESQIFELLEAIGGPSTIASAVAEQRKDAEGGRCGISVSYETTDAGLGSTCVHGSQLFCAADRGKMPHALWSVIR